MSKGPTIGDWTQYEWIPDNASSFPARIRLRDTAWMVYYEPDVTDLKAEVLMLRRENAELRDEIEHLLIKRQHTEDVNAKLRRVIESEIHCMSGVCKDCVAYRPAEDGWCDQQVWLEELGIEGHL